jgi:hypothetical protein
VRDRSAATGHAAGMQSIHDREELTMASVRVDISIGDLVDKIAILRIKAKRLTDPNKRLNVTHELALLETAWHAAMAPSPALCRLEESLTKVNQEIWDLEDRIRDHERRQDFGAAFIDVARAIYRVNDHRAALKRDINIAAGSDITEEKSYAPY